MALLTTSGAGILLPEEVNDLVVVPVTRRSVAYQVSTVVVIGSNSYRIPILAEDPSASFVAEGAEIPADDADVDELEVTPKKCAALSTISRELASDTINPGAQDMIGEALARDSAKVIDRAFFGTTTTNGPSGLQSLTGVAEVEGGSLTSLDAFAEGQSMAETVGAATSFWVASPATALQLAKLKEATGSNRPLLQPDPTKPGRRLILGVPLLVSDAVDDHTVWGIPQAFSYVVQAQEATLDVSTDAFFTSDKVAIKTTLRVAFGWPHKEAIVKIEHGGS